VTDRITVHVNSFGLRFHLRYRPDGFDVFRFIDLAREARFDGVNISANGPGFRDLGGTTTDHFEAVRNHLDGMRCEIDTSDTSLDHMRRMLAVCSAVGADTLRTYTRYRGPLDFLIERTVADLNAIAPIAEDCGVLVVLENHEDFTGKAIATILAEVDRASVRALYDYGNSQMVGEDPMDALEHMAPFVARVHAKDHVVVRSEGRLWVQGVPMGSGHLPVVEQTRRLYEAGVRRFCFESVWAYAAPVQTEHVPQTESFRVVDGSLVIGDAIEPAVALKAERRAFDRGWEWFQSHLVEAGLER
jgi:sugar phosphate isomerase/epimerase